MSNWTESVIVEDLRVSVDLLHGQSTQQKKKRPPRGGSEVGPQRPASGVRPVAGDASQPPRSPTLGEVIDEDEPPVRVVLKPIELPIETGGPLIDVDEPPVRQPLDPIQETPPVIPDGGLPVPPVVDQPASISQPSAPPAEGSSNSSDVGAIVGGVVGGAAVIGGAAIVATDQIIGAGGKIAGEVAEGIGKGIADSDIVRETVEDAKQKINETVDKVAETVDTAVNGPRPTPIGELSTGQKWLVAALAAVRLGWLVQSE